MSSRGEFCRVLDKYKSGAWDRDKAAAQLEKYFKQHTAPSSPSGTLRGRGQVAKVIRCLNRDDHALIEVQLDDGSESVVWVGGTGVEIFHAGKSKFYIDHPWERPAQSRKPLDNVKHNG